MLNTTLKMKFALVLCAATLLLSSCGSKKDVVYFQDISDYETLIDETQFVPKFKVDDVVSIFISTLNPEASAPFNLFRGGSMSGIGGGVAQQVDYLVDQNGNIDFPVIGQIKI